MGTRKGFGNGFRGPTFFFLSVAAKVFFSFFSFAFRHPLECGFEGSRGTFRALPGSLARAKSGHFAKDILQKPTFVSEQFQNPFSSPPGSSQSDFRTPLGAKLEPRAPRPPVRASQYPSNFWDRFDFQFSGLLLDLLSLSNEITIFRQNGHFVRE